MKKIGLTKELVLYVVFGALTTAVSFISYYVCNTMLGIHYLTSNIISWVLAVLFAYVTNKLFVFESKGIRGRELLREFSSFIVARLVSLCIEELGLWLMVGQMHVDENISKLVMQVIVVIANYVFSKMFIFKKPTVEQ